MDDDFEMEEDYELVCESINAWFIILSPWITPLRFDFSFTKFSA